MQRTADIFLSFKNLGVDGRPTEDSVLAEDVYKHLISRGHTVFLSTYDLRQQGVSAYKRSIDHALDVANTLIVIGTSVSHIESEWVRYEWDSFFNDMISGVKPNGRLFCYLHGIELRQLPRTLRQCQAICHSEGSLDQLSDFVAGHDTKSVINSGISPEAIIVLQQLASRVSGKDPCEALWPFVSRSFEWKMERNVCERALGELRANQFVIDDERIGFDRMENRESAYPVLKITPAGWEHLRNSAIPNGDGITKR